jgi:hypothetical protein
MTATNGGRWIFSSTGQPIVLGFNNGSAPVFPPPQPDALNIEVFTNTTVPGVPNADPGFQSSINDPGGTLEMGFLTGTDIRLGGADLLVVDSVTGFAGQGPSKFTLISGNHTVIGASGDTLVGGSGNQILSALAGNQTVIGGTGNASIWGGANDSIALGTGNQQVVVTGPGTIVVGGNTVIGAAPHGSATITTAAQDTVIASGGSLQPLVIAAGPNCLIDLFRGQGVYAVIGGFGDTIRGDGTTYIDGTAGGMLITVSEPGFSNGKAFVTGSAGPVAGDTVHGGGPLVYNPGPAAGKGDLIDLTSFGSPIGPSTINAFAFGSTRVVSPDTILGGWYVFGGDGDRIGTGTTGLSPVPAAQWVHADTVAGSAIGFGSNNPDVSATYDTVAGTVTRNAFHVENASVGGFDTTTDFIFYQNETAQTTSAILATSQATTVNGIQSTIIVLPDSTALTLIGVTQAQLTPALFKP